MSLNRNNPKRDANERLIIDELEAAGCVVIQLSGEDIPDLLVIYRDQMVAQWGNYEVRMKLLEVKNPETARTKSVRAGQKKLHEKLADQVAIVWSPEEALAALGLAAAPELTISSCRIIFPFLHIKLSNGSTHSKHLADIRALRGADDQQRKKRIVNDHSVEWYELGYVLPLDEIKTW